MSRLPKLFLVVLSLAVLISFTTPTFAAETAKGKIKTLFPDKEEFVLTDVRGQDWMFYLGQGTKVFINNKEGRFRDFKVGDFVTITYTKEENRFIASEIRAGEDQAAGTTKGQIRRLALDKNQFVLTDTEGQDWTFLLAEGVKINIDNRVSQLQDLKVGDLVQITYEKRNGTLFAKDIRTLAR